jgi:DNA-binding GntR family transcriptional regulator
MTVKYTFERDRAYQQLLELVLAGALNPDQPLSERKLAESLAVGRTPMREAIKRMTREGLVEVRPARGTYIRQITRSDIQDIYEVRQGVEGTAAFLAAERGPTKEFTKYHRMFREMIERPDSFDLAAIHQAGQDFHVEMFRAARNPYLLEIYEPMRLRHQIALLLPRLYDHAFIHASVHEHLDILSAIEDRDSEKARQLICEHLATGMEVRFRIFDQFEPLNNLKAAAS